VAIRNVQFFVYGNRELLLQGALLWEQVSLDQPM